MRHRFGHEPSARRIGGAVLLPLAAVLLASPTGASSAAPAPSISTSALLAFCRSPTLASAIARGDALGWTRLGDARLDAWKSAFIATNGGSVQAAGWSRGGQDRDDALAFWAVQGDTPYNACAYTTGHAAKTLRRALVAAFGSPASRYASPATTVESWKSTHIEVSFSRVSSTALVYIFTTP